LNSEAEKLGMDEINSQFQKLVEDSTGKILINEETWQTCWLISSDGLLATSGHGFFKKNSNGNISPSNIGELFEIEIKGYPYLKAELIEISFDIKRYLDYALLKINNKNNDGFPYIPICSKMKCCTGNKFFAKGYRLTAQDYQTSVEGKIIGNAFRNDAEKGSFFQLNVDPEKLEGMSGAAICVKCDKQPQLKAIGIQSSQISKARNNAFAVPFNNIVRFSKNFKRIISEMERKNIGPIEIDSDLFSTSRRYVDESPRLFVFIVPHPDIDIDADKLYSKICDIWEPHSKKIIDRAKRIGWLKRVAKIKLSQNSILPDGKQKINDLLNTNFLEKRAANISGIRAVFDLSGNYFSEDLREDIRADHQLSHFIGIKFSDSVEGLSSYEGFDSHVVIKKGSISLARQSIFNAIEDIFFDCYTFHAVPMFYQLCMTPEAKKAFSILKVEFSRQLDLQPYGFTIPEEIEYISLASCCRKSLTSDIDLDKLHVLWHNFANDFLFESIFLRKSNKTPLISYDDICNYLITTKKIGGQLSASNVHKEIQNIQAKKGELCAFGITRKRPRTNKIRDEICALFGQPKFHMNMVKAFPFRTLKQVFSYSEYIKLLFFRKAQ
jgi:hypothetical protein